MIYLTSLKRPYMPPVAAQTNPMELSFRENACAGKCQDILIRHFQCRRQKLLRESEKAQKQMPEFIKVKSELRRNEVNKNELYGGI